MKALRPLLFIFGFFFVLTGIAGYAVGSSEAKARFLVRAVSNISTKETNGGYCLVYRLRNKDMFVFDVGSQRLLSYDATINEATLDSDRAPGIGIFFKNADIAKTAGTAAITFLAGDIYKASALRRALAKTKLTPRWAKLLAGVGGIIGGYKVGYWIGFRPNLDQEELLAKVLLADPAIWKREQFYVANALSLRLEDGIDSLVLEEDRTSLHNELARTQEHFRASAIANGVLSNEDLKSLRDLENKVKPMLILGCAPKSIFWAYVYPHSLWQWIGTCIGLLALLVVLLGKLFD